MCVDSRFTVLCCDSALSQKESLLREDAQALACVTHASPSGLVCMGISLLKRCSNYVLLDGMFVCMCVCARVVR